MLEESSGHIQQHNEASSLGNKKRLEKKANKKSSSLHGEEHPIVVNDLPSEALFTTKPKVVDLILFKGIHFNQSSLLSLTHRPKDLNLLPMSSLKLVKTRPLKFSKQNPYL